MIDTSEIYDFTLQYIGCNLKWLWYAQAHTHFLILTILVAFHCEVPQFKIRRRGKYKRQMNWLHFLRQALHYIDMFRYLCGCSSAARNLQFSCIAAYNSCVILLLLGNVCVCVRFTNGLVIISHRFKGLRVSFNLITFVIVNAQNCVEQYKRFAHLLIIYRNIVTWYEPIRLIHIFICDNDLHVKISIFWFML